MRRLSAVAPILFLLAGTTVAQDAVKKEMVALKGRWTIVSATDEGKKLDDYFKDITLTIDEAGRATVTKGGKVVFQSIIKIDPTKQPKAIDTTQASEGENKGKTSLGIYELTGDSLTLCTVPLTAKQRPTEFSSKPGSGYFLRVYQRAKK